MTSPKPPYSTTPPPAGAFQRLSDEDRHASLTETLASREAGADLWVFGYGSLIWNPEFEFVEKRLTTLRGHHRSLCLWSRINRGTPENPGLVFGLDRGGSCRGMAFRIPAKNIPNTFEALWRREMSTGAYIPRWINCDTDQGEIQALAFLINRNKAGYICGLNPQEELRIVLSARGTYGTCVDYVLQTARALDAAGIRDERLNELAFRIEQNLLPSSNTN